MEKTNKTKLVVGIILVFFLMLFSAYYLSSPRESTIKQSTVTSFVVDQGYFVVTGANLARVEIWGIPTGTNVSERSYILMGEAKKEVSATSTDDVWKLKVPEKSLLLGSIFVKGFDSEGTSRDKIFLPYQGATEIYNALWKSGGQASSTPVRVSFGQEKSVGDITLRFLKVIEDSRCPKGVECVWAGKFVAEVELKKGSDKTVLNLATDDDVARFASGEVKLLGVSPPRVAGRNILNGEYEITITRIVSVSDVEDRAYLELKSHKGETLRIHLPRPGDRVKSPLSITGAARGGWFFEASFPVVLKDKSGALIASGAAVAEGEWMTESFVPFRATLMFPDMPEGNGTLILSKDNPSGLSENDDAVLIPVTF